VRERERLIRLFTQKGEKPDEITRIVAISEVLGGGTRGRWREPIFGIDELDHVLPQIFFGPIDVVSFSGEVEGAEMASIEVNK
jgi:hypothetical protein